MAEFEKAMAALGAVGLQRAAEQLLQRLYPIMTGSEKAEESPGGSQSGSRDFDAGAWKKWAAGEDFGGNAPSGSGTMEAGPYEERLKVSAGDGETHIRTMAGAQPADGPAASAPRAADMRAVSDYFQRDSRRYDREFERY